MNAGHQGGGQIQTTIELHALHALVIIKRYLDLMDTKRVLKGQLMKIYVGHQESGHWSDYNRITYVPCLNSDGRRNIIELYFTIIMIDDDHDDDHDDQGG